MTRVTVIIPTYNRKELLREAIDSVIRQTYTDWELLVVDNGSTDETRAMLRLEYPHVRCHTIPHSAMPADSRNAGIEIATSPYLAFLDSDDVWVPEKLRQQLSALESDARIGWSYSNALCFGPSLPEKTLLYASWRMRSGRIFEHLLAGNCVPTSSVVVRRECLTTVGLFDSSPALRTAEDYELWLRLAWQFPAYAISKPLVDYRVYDQNLSNATGYNAEPAFKALERVSAKLNLPGKIQTKAKAALLLAASRAVVRDNPDQAMRWLSDACRQNPYNLRAEWYRALSKITGMRGLSSWIDIEQRAKQFLC